MKPAAPVLALLALLLLPPPRSATAAEQAILVPAHSHGWWIGDVIPVRATVLLEQGFRIDPASLPQPGALDYWLDLRGVTVVDETGRDGRRLHRIEFTYQTFYAPLEPRAMTIPPRTLAFVRDGQRLSVTVPAWSFVTSPLREIMAPSRPEAMKPDAVAAMINVRPQEWRAALSAGLALLALLLLARHRAWGPFARPDRPFAAAAADIRRLNRRGAGAAAQRAAFLALHRAFDRASGHRLVAADVAGFLAVRPQYRPLSAEISGFFTASRSLFFGRAPEQALARCSTAALAGLARRLARAERGRP